MRMPACRAALWRFILVATLLGMPVSGTALAMQETQELELEIEVVPGVDEDDAGEPDDGATSSGSTAASLLKVDTVPTGGAAQTFTLDLVVADQRSTGRGWIVKVMQSPDAPADPLIVSRYVRRTEAIEGQDIRDGYGPRGYRLAVGQPLDRMTPVIIAQPGAGAGLYSIRFDLTGVIVDPDTVVPLIVSITSAP